MGFFTQDPDGTLHIPGWLNFVVGFVPAPWGQLVQLILKIIDQLPAPKQQVIAKAFAEARVTGDDSKLTKALHEAVVERDLVK